MLAFRVHREHAAQNPLLRGCALAPQARMPGRWREWICGRKQGVAGNEAQGKSDEGHSGQSHPGRRSTNSTECSWRHVPGYLDAQQKGMDLNLE
jgi:hypothetical protein